MKSIARISPSAPAPAIARNAIGPILAEVLPLKRFAKLVLNEDRMREASVASRFERLREQDRPIALAWAERYPTSVEIEQHRDAITATLRENTDKVMAEQVSALLLDSIPSAKNASSHVLDAIAAALIWGGDGADDDSAWSAERRCTGFGRAVLAITLGELISQCKFAPAPAEVLGKAIHVRSRLVNAHYVSERLQHWRWAADDLIRMFDPTLPELGENDIPF